MWEHEIVRNKQGDAFSSTNAGKPGGLRTDSEKGAADTYAKIFAECPESIETKLDNFPKYVRIQALTRFLSRYEIYKKILNIKGSVIECGVFQGLGLMTWAHLSAILEPANFMRRIHGFDTFSGFPSVDPKDQGKSNQSVVGNLLSDSYEELIEILSAYDKNRYLGHMEKVEIIKGNAQETIPIFLETNPHVVISLLYLDFDLYQPTKVAIENFIPRMPKGSIIAFDDLNHPVWPGETLALLDSIGINKLQINRVNFDPYVGYAVID